MSTAIETPFEVMPTDVKSASTELSCPSDKVLTLYKPFEQPFQAAATLLAEEEKATTAADARALRLKMVKARTTITATKDESKSDIKLAANIIDWFHNKGRDRLAAAEARLMEIEKAEERAEAARIKAIYDVRSDILAGLEYNPIPINLGTMPDAQWAELEQNAKDLQTLRIERERVAKEEAEAAARKEAEEREAQRLENIRLKEEAEAREKAMAEERRIAAEAAAKAEAERKAAEEIARKEREAIEAKAKAEREKLEAAAAEERRKAQEIAAKAAKEKAEAEAEAQRLRDAEAKRIADEKSAAEAKAKAEAAAAKKAAAAPDKVKLMGFAGEVAAMIVPDMKSEDGKKVAADVTEKVLSFAKWIQAQAATL